MTKLPQRHAAHPFVAAALRKAIRAVRTAVNGARNETLNREAYALGGFIASGHLDEREVTDALLDAIASNGGSDTRKEAAKIASAIAAGKGKPRKPPSTRGKAEEGEEDPLEALRDGRPSIQITHQLAVMTTQACAALGTDATLYTRDCQLVHVTRIGRDDVERSGVVATSRPPTIR